MELKIPVNIKINSTSIDYMLKRLNMNISELLEHVNKGRKSRLFIEEDIYPSQKNLFSEQTIRIGLLEKIDKVFNQGLSFYTDLEPEGNEKESSIFFRKKKFETDLELADRQTVVTIENQKDYIESLIILSDYHKITRKLKTYNIDRAPNEVAEDIREALYPKRKRANSSDRKFLEDLINKMSEFQIQVQEFGKKREQVKIEGLFIAPYTIAIRRLPKHKIKRQIFTLAHELGHYLLDKEEIDAKTEEIDEPVTYEQNKVEYWCNSFAFAFLLGSEQRKLLCELANPELSHDDKGIKKISKSNHISRLALFTYLVINHRITWVHYNQLKSDLINEFKRTDPQRKETTTDEPRANRKPPQPPPSFHSDFLKDIYRNAYFEGVVEKYDILSVG